MLHVPWLAPKVLLLLALAQGSAKLRVVRPRPGTCGAFSCMLLPLRLPDSLYSWPASVQVQEAGQCTGSRHGSTIQIVQHLAAQLPLILRLLR